MYNRYIPQPDGTYRRNAMQEPSPPRQQPREEPRHPEPIVSPPPQQEVPPCQKGQPCIHMRQNQRPAAPPNRGASPSIGVGNFFRQLLPQNFDTEDLIIVLLLLLMAGDCREEQNSALLTLALYLFL